MKIYNQRKFKERRQWLRNNCLKPERILWYKIRGKQLGYKFRRQHGIGNYIVDFYCPDLKLIVEVDGSVHSVKEVYEKDLVREKILKKNHSIIKRYTAVDILKDLDNVLLDLKYCCDKINNSNPT